MPSATTWGKMIQSAEAALPFHSTPRRWPVSLSDTTYRRLLALSFLALFLFRLSLISRGVYGWPDEKRYLSSLDAAFKIFAGNFAGACTDLSTTQGRPGDALLRVFPALLQVGLQRWFGMPTSDPASLLIPLFFNVIVSMLVAVVFYKIARRLFNSQPAGVALAGTVVFALLTNTNIYVRHLLPYDTSLLIFLVALLLALPATGPAAGEAATTGGSAGLGRRRAVYFLIGGLVGLGYAVYPGYYFFPIVIFALLLFDGSRPFLAPAKVLNLLGAGLAVILVLFFFEIVAEIGDTSYIAVSILLSGTIDNGTFEEGFVFLPEYLLQVDTLIGGLLLVLTAVFLGHTLYRLARYRAAAKLSRLEMLVLLALAGYLFHATESAVFHKMVFYGRILHLYMPFLALAGTGALLLLKDLKIRRYAFGLTLLFSVVSFGQFAFSYLPLAYPDSVLADQHLNPANYGVILARDETAPCYQQKTPPAAGSSSAQLVLVNFCFFTPITQSYIPYKPDPGQKLLYSGRHFLTYPAYTFEMYGVEDRQTLQNRAYRVQVYASDPATQS